MKNTLKIDHIKGTIVMDRTFAKLIPISSLLGIFWGLITILPFALLKSTPVITIPSKSPSIVIPDKLEPFIDLFITFCGSILIFPT